MRWQLVASVLSTVSISGVSAQTTGKLGNAAVISNNPVGASYIATLPGNAFFTSAYPNGGNVQGSVQAVSSPDGQGVLFQVKLSNLPSEGGPFLYHIHDQPVPADGNCNGTLAHLDPYERGETPPCDASRPETCQVGDLGGKHGEITSSPFNDTYTEYYASTLNGIGAFFGNRSFVVHFNNVTRITCANFTVIDTSSSSGPGSSTTTSSSTSTTSTVSSTSQATATGLIPTTTFSPGGSNATAATPPSSTTFVTAAASTNIPAAILGLGAAVLALVL